MHNVFNNNFYSSTAILNNRSLQCKEYGQKSFNEEFCNYKTISLIHINIRSTKRNLNVLKTYLSTIKHEFSSIGLSETWLNSINIDLYNDIPKYNYEHYIRTNKEV